MKDKRLRFHIEISATATPTQQQKPERNLVSAIIERAMLDAISGGSTKKFERYSSQGAAREAYAWLFEWKTEDASLPWSFPWCCHQMDWDPVLMRDGIKKTLPDFKKIRSDRYFRSEKPVRIEGGDNLRTDSRSE